MSETGTGKGAEGRRPSASEAELVADLKPSGALERMMIEQMARAHDTTMACFDRAEAAPEGAGREVELRLAARFMALFMQQAATLDRRRAQARQAEEATQRLSFDAQAAQTRSTAEDDASAGDFDAAIEELEKSTQHIARAIRSAGVYIPGG